MTPAFQKFLGATTANVLLLLCVEESVRGVGDKAAVAIGLCNGIDDPVREWD